MPAPPPVGLPVLTGTIDRRVERAAPSGAADEEWHD
jgi:hypothetical protein